MLRKKITLKSGNVFPGKHFFKNCLLKLQSHTEKKLQSHTIYKITNYENILSKLMTKATKSII